MVSVSVPGWKQSSTSSACGRSGTIRTNFRNCLFCLFQQERGAAGRNTGSGVIQGADTWREGAVGPGWGLGAGGKRSSWLPAAPGGE